MPNSLTILGIELKLLTVSTKRHLHLLYVTNRISVWFENPYYLAPGERERET